VSLSRNTMCSISSAPGSSLQNFRAREAGTSAERFLNSQPFVPFGHPFRTCERADLQLLHAPADCKMHERHVFRLPRARGQDCSPAGGARRLYGSERLGHGAHLVWFDQGGVAGARASGIADTIGIGDEKVIANDLDAISDRSGETDQAGLIIFRKRRIG
jgi:hypothetical protein